MAPVLALRLAAVLALGLLADPASAGAACRPDALGNLGCRPDMVGDGRAALPERSVLGPGGLDAALDPDPKRPGFLPGSRRRPLGGLRFERNETLGRGPALSPQGSNTLRCRPDSLGNLRCR